MDPTRISLRFLVAFQCIAIPCAVAFAASNSIDDDPAAWEFTDGSISITCVDPTGQPIVGAELEMATWDYEWPPERQRESIRARADVEGRYTFENLSGQVNYAVYAKSGEYGCWEPALRVKPSQKHLNITMKLDIYNSVVGRVLNGRGEPVPGVQISNRGAILGAVTDDGGWFRVSHLTDQQEFRFYKPGYGWINSGLIPTIRVFELTLPDGGLCEFTVVDAEQKPVPAAKISYDCGNAYYGGGALAGTVTDADGKALSTWIPVDSPTEVFAYYERDGYVWSCKETVTVRASETVKLVLKPTATSKIEMSTHTGSAVPVKEYKRLDAPKGSVGGKVVMEDTGEPVVASIAFDSSHEWVRQARGGTNDAGEFRIDGIEPGNYYFTALPRDPTLFNVGGLTRVTVTEDKPVTDLVFKIGKGCVVRGDVKSADGLPVPSAQVSVKPDNANHYLAYWTDAKGHFFLPHQVHPNKKLTVMVYGPRGLTASKDVGPFAPGTISEPIDITIDSLFLARGEGNVLRGTVFDENNEPVAGVKVGLPPNIAPDTCLTDDNGVFRLHIREPGTAQFTVQSERSVLLNGEIETDRNALEIFEGGTITIPPAGDAGAHVIRVRTTTSKPLGGFVCDENGAPLNANLMVYVADCQGSGRADNGAFLKLGCSKPFTQGPVLLEFTLEGYQARVIESGRDFELGDTNIRVVMKKGPFEPFTSVFAAVTGRDPKEADTMFRGDRILDNCGHYWRLAGGASSREAPIWLVVRDEKGAPVTQITTQMTTGPIIHSQDDEKKYANTIVPLSNELGQYTLKQGGVFVWAEGKGKVYFHHPNGNRRGEPAFITLEPEATLTVNVVDSGGSPVKGAVVSLINEDKDKDWPRYIDSSPPRIPTGSTGTVVFTKLPAGNYEVNAWVQYIFSATRSGQQTIQLKAGESRSVTLVLKP